MPGLPEVGTTLRVEHKIANDYRVEFVSGASLAGPMPDGTFRLTLHRDLMSPAVELMEVKEHSADGESIRFAMKGVEKTSSPIVKEDFVTLVLTQSALKDLARLISPKAEVKAQPVSQE